MDELELLAPQLNRLPVDPNATMGFDFYAGGLCWSDERPVFEESTAEDGQIRLVGLGCFRALLNYRSTLVVGTPAERYCELWAKAILLCPNWPGFSSERRNPTLADQYRTMSDASRRSWEVLGSHFERQQNTQATATKI